MAGPAASANAAAAAIAVILIESIPLVGALSSASVFPGRLWGIRERRRFDRDRAR
jgi:hypothetical protein